MNIVAFKPGHDGSAAYVSDGNLVFSHETEKDSGARYSALDITSIIHTLEDLPSVPDVLAISGWEESRGNFMRPIGHGYLGLEPPTFCRKRICGREARVMSSSHERSHLLCAYALSPFPQGTPCYALLWEGYIGRFYRIDEKLNITVLSNVMWGPGLRYGFAYGLMDESFCLPPGAIRLVDAGKLMALAAFHESETPTSTEREVIDALLANPERLPKLSKSDFRSFPQYNCGVTSNVGKRWARLISDAIYQYFIQRIRPLVDGRSPLLVCGGCALNCDWNSSLLETGLFSDVFVPPCPNDTGSAIGTAADVQFSLTGSAKLRWSVYAGQALVLDDFDPSDFVVASATPGDVAKHLLDGAILGWACGKAEIGPRALGHRSILASPLQAATLHRLNQIKQRESFRPIAPVCREEELAEHFAPATPSPYMLFFHRVLTSQLPAITHVDGSARVQTLSRNENPALHEVLSEFRKLSGVGVLCNTSLNFKGAGFINRRSDLARFSLEAGLDGFVAENRLYLRKQFLHSLR